MVIRIDFNMNINSSDHAYSWLFYHWNFSSPNFNTLQSGQKEKEKENAWVQGLKVKSEGVGMGNQLDTERGFVAELTNKDYR